MTVDARARPARQSTGLGTFERYLTLWVALCIVAGIHLGRTAPGPFRALGRMTLAEVNIPVAVLIWLMIVPMLLKVDFGALHSLRQHWRGIGVTLVVNWAIKPFSIAAWDVLPPLFVRPDAAGRRILVLYCGPDPAGRSAMHGNGLRLVEPSRG